MTDHSGVLAAESVDVKIDVPDLRSKLRLAQGPAVTITAAKEADNRGYGSPGHAKTFPPPHPA